uniref:Uncharacterized protein n=1 Tax=Lactuca sativa TaxID=4236 RepID=A0A9R1XHT3_LACSA|nr:hypothetical protein LSAT_V11C500272790 [Lactuca sativa]
MMMPKVIQRGLLAPFLALNVCFKLHLKELNKKLDSVLENSNAFSSTKWETLLTTHRATVEMLTLTNAHVIEGFQTSLQVKKEALSVLRFGIQKGNVDPHTSFSERILRLQNDLATENKIMDALVEQTQKTKVLQ